MQRMGGVLRLKPEALETYTIAHAAVWPEVLSAIYAANIRNYSIYHKDGFLFSYFEYHGTNYALDSERMATNPVVQKWWAIMEPLQDPLPSRQPGEWWAQMDEVFHVD